MAQTRLRPRKLGSIRALRIVVAGIVETAALVDILEIVGNIMILSNFVSEYLIGAIQGAIIIIAMLVQRSLSRR